MFASSLFFWGSDSDGMHGLTVSSSIAAIAVLVWAVLVTMPMVTHSSDEDRQRERRQSIKASPLYEFVSVVICRLFPVWIMVTLMRPLSCVYSESSMATSGVTDASNSILYSDTGNSTSSGSYVLSTAGGVSCGGGGQQRGNWATLASMVLLSFFLVTSCVLHSDDAQLMADEETSKTTHGVRFAPIYAMVMRIGQFFVCAVCASLFSLQSTVGPLGLVVSLTFFMAVFPLVARGGVMCR